MMRTIKALAFVGLAVVAATGCSEKRREYNSYDDYPVPAGKLQEMEYTPESTTFRLWAPTADHVILSLYESGYKGTAYTTVPMDYEKEGVWMAVVKRNLAGQFYTFNVKMGERWLGKTPGINARAVGVNGDRAAVIDMRDTDPPGWQNDKRPELKSPADIIIYEMHHRDFSVHESSGMEHKGKYLALTEEQTTVPGTGLPTGIGHLKELGITHVHLLPSFDYATIDETRLSDNIYNWGYDPKNYNVPEGSYATDPCDPGCRINEFKRMVQALHKAGIRVVLDVVYNHTYSLEGSAFERTVPGYFYRKDKDGAYADASACGNEVASERAMVRKYMIESVLYWMEEYHIDGFRFDLMGIHDIETMNEIRKAVDKVDPTVYIYGEGWAAKPPQYPGAALAMKGNAGRMPGIAVFSDELRDGLRGPVSDDKKGGFLAGVPGNEESLKFGIVGGIQHPQVDYSKVNYTDTAWALQPVQLISYVSCHDDLCLVDRLKATIPGISGERLRALGRLAQTAVFTSQGIPFIYAGEEVLRDKQGVHNSFKSPDAINAIDWNRKDTEKITFSHYANLIKLRREHPAFRMGDAELVRKHLEFLPVDKENVVAFRLKDNANGDEWKEIIVILNGSDSPVRVTIPWGEYTSLCADGVLSGKDERKISNGKVQVKQWHADILYKK